MSLSAEQVTRARARAIAAGLPKLHDIIHAVCDEMGADIAEVKGRVQGNALLTAARLECARCAHEAGFTASQIGRVMCRDHSTILWQLRQE